MANHRSILRSLKDDVSIALHMAGREFIPNVYARENARDSHTLAFEDRFKRKRTSDINARFPKAATTSSQSHGTTSDTAPPKADDADTIGAESEKPEADEGKQAKKEEVGSFINFSGEVISAGKLHISGSGGLYNITDSVMQSSGGMSLNFLGRILHKYRSKIESDKNIFATTKLGTFFCENSQITSANMKLISQELALDEASQITGIGLLDLRSGVIVNRGLVNYDGSVSVEYGKFDNSGTMRSKGKVQVKPMTDL